MRIPALPIILIIGCSPRPPEPALATSNAEKIDLSGIENAYRVTPSLYSGGMPEGDAAFAELKKLGVKTIISVDGMTPDAATAERFGMRYVHLPVGYGGISTKTAYSLAKAVQSLPGPIFLHCHHGRHRGPAAVAAVRICLEPDYTPAQARVWMELAGTDPKFQGLMKLPSLLARPTPEQMAAVPTDFPARSPISDLTRCMVNIDEHWETIRVTMAKEWLGADSAAMLLAEDFRDAKRTLVATSKGQDFNDLLRDAEAAATELGQVVKENRLKEAPAVFAKNQAVCAKCHTKFRD